MLLLQLKYETLRLLRSNVFWLLLVVLAISTGFGLQNGLYRAAEKRDAVDKMLDKQYTDLAKQKLQADSVARQLKTVNGWWQDPTNVVVVGGVWRGGWVTALEPMPQSMLAVGMSDLQNNAWRLTLMGKVPWGGNELENPENLSIGTFDLSFVLIYLLPLLVIALSFNLISGEKEQGTLALHLSQPQTINRLFSDKMIARFALLGILTIGTVLPGLVWSGISLSSAAAWQTVGVAVLYSLFWFLVALGVNLRGGTSAQNALLSIGAWLLFTIMLPALVNMLAEKVHPVPSRATYMNQIRSAENYIESKREALLNEFYAYNPQHERKADADKSWRDWYREDFFLRTFDKKIRDSIEHIYTSKSNLQSAFSERLTVFSPALSVHRQMTDLAGTSHRALKTMEPKLDEAQRKWSAWFIQKFDANQNLSAADYDEFMKFPDRVQASIPSGGNIGLGLLFLQCLLAGAWAWWNGRNKSLILN